MTIRQIDLDELTQTRMLVPQAIANKRPAVFAQKGYVFERGCDDLDYYKGAAFMLTTTEGDDIPFVLIRHRGHPFHTTTIEIPIEIEDLDRITYIIDEILANFGMTEKDLFWHRRDGLDY